MTDPNIQCGAFLPYVPGGGLCGVTLTVPAGYVSGWALGGSAQAVSGYHSGDGQCAVIVSPDQVTGPTSAAGGLLDQWDLVWGIFVQTDWGFHITEPKGVGTVWAKAIK